MRASLVAAALAWLGVYVSACGAAGSGPQSKQGSSATSVTNARLASATLPQPKLYGDPDLDSDIYPGERDEDNTYGFGHAAGAADARAATLLVTRYYGAAAAGNGALACGLMYSPVAESVPEDYGPSAGAAAAYTESCAMAAKSVFKRLRGELSVDSATLRVVAVKVRNREAAVVLNFGRKRRRNYLLLHRERDAWKVSRLLASEKPIYVE
jgi:hypothetical protein